MALRLISPPDEYAVTVEELKEHLRVDSDDDQALIESYLQAAIDHVDGKYGVLQKALVPQTWELSLDRFPCGAIDIPLPPLLEVASIVHDGADDSEGEATIDVANYYVDTASVPGRVVPVDGFSWPSVPCAPGAVRILFTAGHLEIYTGENGVPPSIKQAIKLIAADWYRNREDRALLNGPHVNIPTAAKALLDQHRIPAMA